MKPALATSTALHVALLTWGLWSLSSPKALDVAYTEALPVEIVMADQFEGVKGEDKKPVKDKPAPTPTKKPATLPMPAENPGDNEADLTTPPVPDVKPNKIEPTPTAARTDLPPPPDVKPVAAPAPEPAKVAAKAPTPPAPTPPKPAPTPAPEPAKVEPKPAAQPDLVEQAIADAEALPPPAPKSEPAPQKVPVPLDKPKPAKPEPEKAEEKPADTPAETPVAKADKAVKPDQQKRDKIKDAKIADKKSDAPEKSDSLENDIAALLSKQKASGGGAKRSTEEASLGSKKTTGTTLSRSEIGALQGMIQEQMAKCWSPPTGLEDAGSLRVSIRIRFDPSGALDGMPTIVNEGSSGRAQQVASEAALRAIRRCAPFNLPADKYAGGWDQTTLNFDPSQMN